MNAVPSTAMVSAPTTGLTHPALLTLTLPGLESIHQGRVGVDTCDGLRDC